jgi:TonB family protein
MESVGAASTTSHHSHLAPTVMFTLPSSVRLWLAVAAVGVLSSTARAQDGSPATVRPDRVRRVTIDSTRISVTIGERRSLVRVETPLGVYLVTADSAVLAGWADAVARLAVPRPGEGGAVQYDGIVLRQPNNPDAMQLTRLTADSAPDYQLDVSNGGWSHAVRVRAAVAETLFAALRGVPGERGAADIMTPETIYFEFQVDQPVVPERGGPRLKYPPALAHARVSGRVVLQYIVGTDGRPRPSSLLVIESSHPEFTRAAGEAVRAMRFRPARRSGTNVAQYVQQPFEFKIP